MPRLLSRTKWGPGGFQVLHPEAGMKQPFSGSFNEAVNFELAFRRKNPALAQRLNLPPDPESAIAWVDEQNAIRYLQHGLTQFVDMQNSPSFPIDEGQKKNLFGRVAGVVGKGRAAMDAYTSMFGSQGPDTVAVAERRAALCSVCPKNEKAESLQDYFAQGVANAIMGILGALHDLGHKVKDDASLGICKACDCPLKAKVFVRLDHITPHMPPDVWQRLPRQIPLNPSQPDSKTVPCWILSESGKA